MALLISNLAHITLSYRLNKKFAVCWVLNSRSISGCNIYTSWNHVLESILPLLNAKDLYWKRDENVSTKCPEYSPWSLWWVLKGFRILSWNIHQSWARRSQSNLDPISSKMKWAEVLLKGNEEEIELSYFMVQLWWQKTIFIDRKFRR